ncbi:DUF4184 family protein [Pontibacter cellulosilyticus]|uniref:DUF4184 family protein n=1 Tax=Pontibacter cellulosilyticus TaxID=1720253 RepID=A0A923SIE7_9BACT|nr:DUF4184 family protein [Pontibacter cellulosilyticus]MBC5992527.1 DUF4184 family protein [Pontibacter cellulosilyticus]
MVAALILFPNMPFTFSHPAAIVPFRLLPKKWTSLTGLVTGSIVPDFEKFLKMEGGNTFSHSWEGLLWFNIPLGVCLALLFHVVVRNPLLDNLPLLLKQKLICFRGYDWYKYFRENFFVVILSILFGAVSHLLLDSLTHNNNLTLQLLPFLKVKITLWNHSIQLFQLLDLICSVLGGFLILLLLIKLPSSKSKPRKSKSFDFYWLLVLTIAVLAIVLRLSFNFNVNDYWSLLFTTISAVLIGVTISSLIFKGLKLEQKRCD